MIPRKVQIFISAFSILGSGVPTHAADEPDFERVWTEATRAREGFQTLRDAKGNRIQLLTQEAAKGIVPDLWSQLDLVDNHVPGTSTEKAYATMNLKRPTKPILVAVLDSGVDTKHPDLKGVIWENEAEKNAKPGVDDDGDGYIDDVNGWNFIGGAGGKNVGATNLELTRELRRMREKKDGWFTSFLMSRDERTYLAELETQYADIMKKAEEGFSEFQSTQKSYLEALAILKEAGLRDESLFSVNYFLPTSRTEALAKATLQSRLESGYDSSVLRETVEYYATILDSYLNLDYDSSAIIGDDPKNLKEKFYGNPDVTALGAEHGTHCAGIIGALRDNGIGLKGQSNFLKIMPIRAVPNGDERDKDVANGIRFAVDHGARIISMSFGKKYSPHKAIVDSAVAYAASKDVLLVHAAGNDSKNLETEHNYPSAKFLNGRVAENWIEVGASTKFADEQLPALFSNYSEKIVDLFAPGKNIYSTTPNGAYAIYSGTSMAAPEVAGIAALILSQKPNLKAVELKKILLSTVTPFGTLEVFQPMKSPRDEPRRVPFSTLSKSGGVVNALEALKAI